MPNGAHPETAFVPAVYATLLDHAATPAHIPPLVGEGEGAVDVGEVGVVVLFDEEDVVLFVVEVEAGEDDGAAEFPAQALTELVGFLACRLFDQIRATHLHSILHSSYCSSV